MSILVILGFGIMGNFLFSLLPIYLFYTLYAKLDYFEGSMAFSQEFSMTFQTPKHAGESGEFFGLFEHVSE